MRERLRFFEEAFFLFRDPMDCLPETISVDPEVLTGDYIKAAQSFSLVTA